MSSNTHRAWWDREWHCCARRLSFDKAERYRYQEERSPRIGHRSRRVVDIRGIWGSSDVEIARSAFDCGIPPSAQNHTSRRNACSARQARLG